MALLKTKQIHLCVVITLIFSIFAFNSLFEYTHAQSNETIQIVFISDRNGNNDIFTIDPNGNNLQAVLTSPQRERWPSFSPGRDRIVFNRITTALDEDQHGDLHVLDLASGELMRLTAQGDAHQPTWTPEGEQIAFDAFLGGLQVVNADGSGGKVLVNDGFADRPGWAPNARDIAYHLIRPGDSAGLFLYDGFLLFSQQILDFGFDPSISPDGTKVAFSSDKNGNFDVFVADINGNNVINLTATSTAGDAQPVWSPDGQQIAFSSSRDGNSEIYIMDADGSNQRNITNSVNSNEFDPDW